MFTEHFIIKRNKFGVDIDIDYDEDKQVWQFIHERCGYFISHYNCNNGIITLYFKDLKNRDAHEAAINKALRVYFHYSVAAN